MKQFTVKIQTTYTEELVVKAESKEAALTLSRTMMDKMNTGKIEEADRMSGVQFDPSSASAPHYEVTGEVEEVNDDGV